ncbi:FAD/NAD-P-binding domain-containing protein [Amylostereum chailletii]|nr:FAD/NAD-P-binding domain-containing protein [Amylostereum chailletii]
MSATRAIASVTSEYLHVSLKAAKRGRLFTLLSPARAFSLGFTIFYILVQRLIILFFKPTPPKSDRLQKPYGRIAVVGAGLTGVSSAAHAMAHNFDVVIFESHSSVGGIWANVNKTSGLQLNSLLYRFHPGVLWTRTFPYRDEILSEITRIWKEYKLESRTRFNTAVTNVRRADGTTSPGAKWIVNDGAEGVFDAVIVTVGTCGEPQTVGFPGMPKGASEDNKQSAGEGKGDKPKAKPGASKRDSWRWANTTNDSPLDKGAPSFANVAAHKPSADSVALNDFPEDVEHGDPERASEAGTHKELGSDNGEDADDDVFEGTVLHSSQLDDAPLEGKTIVVVGSGASGVEAVETALEYGAKTLTMIARDDKWIIPRNMFIDTSISAQPFGREMPLSFIWEWFIKVWQYHGVEDLIPTHKGIYEGTPVVNDEFLGHVRSGRVQYVRGDTQRLTRSGVEVSVRPRGTKPGDTEGAETKEFKGDVVVLATGFHKPTIDFLPDDLFPEGYARPDLYLQNFSTQDWSVLCTNSSYVNAIGDHIGIYTRILLLLLLDEGSRPEPRDMKLWVDVVRFVKRGARGGALGFFTYMELVIWFLTFHLFRPDRIRWVFFTMQGWGVGVRT